MMFTSETINFKHIMGREVRTWGSPTSRTGGQAGSGVSRRTDRWGQDETGVWGRPKHLQLSVKKKKKKVKEKLYPH